MKTAASAYLDDAGKPRLRQSATGFIDVLGFSQMSTAATAPEESQRTLDRVAAAISDARAFVREFSSGHPLADPTRWAIKFFSDNLVFGFLADVDDQAPAQAAAFAIHCIQRYQLHMAVTGYFVRGAATLGPICLTDEIIFGSALVECYRLESRVSVVPRVILTEVMVEQLIQSARSNHAFAAEAMQGICKDIDGWWFVNYLNAAVRPGGVDWGILERHKTSVLASLSNTTAHDVLPKFGWACRYHNVFCHWHRRDPGYADRYRIDRIDEQSTILRLQDLPNGTQGETIAPSR